VGPLLWVARLELPARAAQILADARLRLPSQGPPYALECTREFASRARKLHGSSTAGAKPRPITRSGCGIGPPSSANARN